MLMSDSVAVLMPIHPNPYVTVFPPPPCDPDYFLDLKKHLQENAELSDKDAIVIYKSLRREDLSARELAILYDVKRRLIKVVKSYEGE